MTSTHKGTALLLVAALLSTSACGRGKKSVPGLEKFEAGVIQTRLYVSFVSTTLQWDQGLTLPIPGLRDATVSVAPDLASLGTVFQFSIGLASFVNTGDPLLLSGLPDGRPLPDVRSGRMPRWDAEIRGLPLSLYLSDDAFALFVPLDFTGKNGVTLPAQVSVQIEDERGNTLGRAYAIPANQYVRGGGSGLFILLPFPGAPGPANEGLIDRRQ